MASRPIRADLGSSTELSMASRTSEGPSPTYHLQPCPRWDALLVAEVLGELGTRTRCAPFIVTAQVLGPNRACQGRQRTAATSGVNASRRAARHARVHVLDEYRLGPLLPASCRDALPGTASNSDSTLKDQLPRIPPRGDGQCAGGGCTDGAPTLPYRSGRYRQTGGPENRSHGHPVLGMYRSDQGSTRKGTRCE
jgi:hypothetical protein